MDTPLASGRYGADGLGGPRRPTASDRVYGGLLRVYPRDFRVRYGDEMVVLFGDQLRDARSAGTNRAVAATWLRTLIDLARSAVGEHLRRDRTVAQSLATFETTPTMRLLGLLAIVGGLVLVGVFFWAGLFVGPLNTIRLVLFALAGVAVALAFHRQQSAVAPRLATVATAAVVLAGMWYLTSNIVALNWPRSSVGVGGLLYSLSSLSLWLSAGLYGAISLRTGAAGRGMRRWIAAIGRMAALVLAIGGPLAALGDDRWGLTDNEALGDLLVQATLLGVFLTGTGWGLLGAVLAFGGRSAEPRADRAP